MQENLVSIFFSQAGLKGDTVALKNREGGGCREISWKEYAAKVRRLSAAMVDLGIEEGDRVAIFSYNSPEWAITDLASLSARAMVVPIYFRSSATQVQYIMLDSGAKSIMAGNKDQLDTVLSIRKELPELKLY